MHHYSHRTCRANLGSGTRINYLWQEHIPREAVRHPFLMHGVLALSALHLASARPAQAQKYASLCDKHQAIALASYRGILGHITEDVANAIFALSTILSISSLARAALRASLMPEPQHISVDAICELLYMTRGVREVREAAGDAILKGPFSVLLFGHQRSSDVQVTFSTGLADTFRSLERMMYQYITNSPEKLRLCLNALEMLQNVFKNAVYFYTRNELEMGHIWSWTAGVGYDFIKLVQSSYPPALVLCAYFSMATLMMKHTWYVTTWGRFAFQGIVIALNGQLREHLDWCYDQLATDIAGMKHDAASIETIDELHGEPLLGVPTPDPQVWVDKWSELQQRERTVIPGQGTSYSQQTTGMSAQASSHLETQWDSPE